MRRFPLAAAVFLASGCAPELGDVPFACGAGEVCPEGYACQSTVCVREGAAVGPSRPARVTWINAAEMYWMERAGGGAALVVNDGFSPDAHGVYEILVSPDGVASAPKLLLGYGDEMPISSSVVALDDARYAMAMLRFPNVDEDAMTLEILAVEREAPGETSPGIERLYAETEPFLGGVEPPYVGAVAASGAIDVAWTRPSEGGRVEVLRITRNGSVWGKSQVGTQPLPADILPLSGDCVLWRSGRSGEDALTVRVGFETFAIGKVDAAGDLAPPALLDGVPLYAAGDEVLVLRREAYDERAGTYAVSFARMTTGGDVLGEAPGGVLQAALEPYTGTPYEGGALIAPLALEGDASFSTLDVGFWSPGTDAPVRVGRVPRTSGNEIYSARAFAADGKVYVAWTEFHESLMDLWVAVVPFEGGQ
ncbi:hypothetical protein [Chondromyces apiculatus]|uniref:Lipoprotein n=1 Tax=Chondromyces apiculatus DSM 436 TaxID=1192034 RepID=A0A017SZI2_9BACT|nr:hypothetical protein [Chondromyces apiculatus]EYF02162.1 Hypothetical protein CAP_7373 [Chondromyces apiculatus DSM 436]